MKTKHQMFWLGGLVLALLLVLLHPFLSGQTLLPSDTVKSLPFARFGAAQMFGHGHVVQWIPYLFGGMPCYASIMVTPTYLMSVISSWGLGSVLPIFKDPVVLHVFHLLLLGCGSFLYLRRRELSWLAAGFAALSLTFGTTLVGLMGAGHTIKLWTVCWMPLNLYLLEGLLTDKRLRALPVAALGLAMLLSVKHIQMSWYFLLFAGVYTLVRLWQMRREPGRPWLGAGLRALAWVGLALALAAFLYLPVLEYSGMSMRSGTLSAVAGGSYAEAYSFPPSDLLSWWMPGARGFGGADYWGALEYTAFPLYAGALWLPLLAVAFWKAEDRRRIWPWLLPSLLLLILGLGRHTQLFDLLVKGLPGYAKLRAHMWALALTQLGLVFSAGVGLDRLLKLGSDAAGAKLRRGLLGVSLGALVLAGLFWGARPDPAKGLPPGTSYSNPRDTAMIQNYLIKRGQEPRQDYVDMVHGGLRAERAAQSRGDAARTLLFVALAGGALWLHAQRELPTAGLAVWLGLLTAADLVWVDRQTLVFEPRGNLELLFRPRGALAELVALPEKNSFRIWPDGVYRQNEPAWHELHSIEGYHGAKPAGIQQVLTDGRVNLPDGSGSSLHPAWLDLLNVQWVISRSPLPWLQPVGRFGDDFLFHNPGALPRLSFPAGWEAVAGEQQFERVMNGLDPRALAVLDPAPALPPALGSGQGRVLSYEPDRVEYAITCGGPTLALLSEIWLPKGWVATLDGQLVPILRADHLLRAVALPAAGDHRLVLEYRPQGWVIGRWISLITLLLLLLVRFGWRRH